jgi:hypothetical protein
MVTIAWNPFESPMLDALPKGRKFDAEYEPDNILIALVPLHPRGEETCHSCRQCKSPYGSKVYRLCAENGLPPAWPHFAPSAFLLFGHVTHYLQGMVLALCEELLAVIREMVTDIPKETLPHVFNHWM